MVQNKILKFEKVETFKYPGATLSATNDRPRETNIRVNQS